MGINTYVECDACGDVEAPYDAIRGGVSLKQYYTQIMETGDPVFDEVDGWVVKIKQDPEDTIAVIYEYFCPQCVADEMVEDSGDRKL